MRKILDLEHLFLISRIAQKWNRAKIFIAAISFSPENPFHLRTRAFLRTRICGFSKAITRKSFYSCKPIFWGNLLDPPI
jgi:hypothetical protein